MKIKLTIPAGFLTKEKDLVINAANIESMVANDDDGTTIQMIDGTTHDVKETVKEIIALYSPAPPTPPTPPTPATPPPSEA